MDNQFFERPILNSPYDDPKRHWELDDQGQPTQRIIVRRRIAEFITPIPKPRKRKTPQQDLTLDEGLGISTTGQQYATTPPSMSFAFKWRNGAWRPIPPTGA